MPAHFLQDPPNPIIHGTHHSRVGFSLWILDVAKTIQIFFRCFQGGVRGVVGKKEKERPIPVPFDEGNRLIGKVIGQVFSRRNRFEIFHQPGAVAFGLALGILASSNGQFFREIDVATSQMSVKLVESTLHRMAGGNVSAQMPLSNNPGMITGGPQEFRNGFLLSGEAHIGILRLVLGVSLEAKPLGIAGGHETGARRATDGVGNVPVGATHSVPGNGINMRRRNVLASVEADVRIAQIVAHNHNHVGLPNLGRSDLGKK